MKSPMPVWRVTVALAFTLAFATAAGVAHAQVTKYVRYTVDGTTSYGIVDGDNIRELAGDLFASPRPTGKTVRLDRAKLLAPVMPRKVIAVGLNYQTHLGTQNPAAYPGLFLKLPSSIVGPGDDIVYPSDATNLHYEGEMVVVIGKRASNVSVADAGQYIFGITVGNDVSERAWQQADLQWFRAKASDTFGPLGPMIVTGLNYDDLLLQTRLNGTVVQSQRTKDLIFNVRTIVSYVSKYVTLDVGDVIYTGTPGTTKAMVPGDSVEIELEGVGILKNRVVRASR